LLSQAEAKYDKQQYKDACQVLENLIGLYDGQGIGNSEVVFLHPSHFILTSAFRVLSDCQYKLGDFLKSYHIRCQVIERLKLTIEECSIQMAMSYFEMGEALNVCLKLNIWNENPGETSLKKAQLKECYQICYDIRILLLAASHPMVLEVQNRLNALK
jgi:hypothetical protein